MESEYSTVIGFKLLMLVVVHGVRYLLRRSNQDTRSFFTILFFVALSGFVGTYLFSTKIFYQVLMIAWVIFAHTPLFLLGSVYILYNQNRRLASVNTALAVFIFLVYVDAFFIEPRWLQVTKMEIPAKNLPSSIRIAIVTDIQTDEPGQYEKRVLERVKAEAPHLILFGGDYLQLEDYNQYIEKVSVLNEMLQEINLYAPLGIYAIGGNIDWGDGWQAVFTGLPVLVFDETRTVDLGPLVLTGLGVHDSYNTELRIEGQEKYHIVLGHNPNFSLGQVNADMLIAGHTHGGQVQIPFFGPIMTLSEVPRSWTSGVTAIEPGKTLIVSRGIGMERSYTPQMRFLCRPELIILDLVPSE